MGAAPAAFVLAAGIAGLCVLGAAAMMSPEAVIQNWPGRSRSEARLMIAKYGEPASYDDDSLVWRMNGPWQETVLYRVAPRSIMGYHGRDILKQSIAYVVPSGKIGALRRFDGRLKFDRASGRLSVISESEDRNFLSLNLADEIVTGKRTAEDARLFYRKTIKLTSSGKSSPYLEGFLFPINGDSMGYPSGNPNPVEEPYRSGMPNPRQ